MRRSERCGLCWTFTETDTHSPWQRTYRFDFSYIRSVPLRREMQAYFWCHYRNGDKTLATLRQEHSWLKYYETWLYERGIGSLTQIRPADAEGFLTYLHTCVSKKTNRPLRLITQKHIYDTVRGVYRWYALRRPEYAVAARMFPTDVYQRINRVRRTTCVSESDVEQFLQVMEQTENPCLRYGTTILAVTGLAPGDLLSLRTDCIQTDEKGVSLRYFHHRKHVYRTIPVNETCARAVQMLKEQTEGLRRSAPEERRQQLFLHCGKWEQVTTPDADLFRYWMRRAQKEARTGNLLNDEVLTATMLRCALLQDMWERKVPYMVIRELTGYPLFTERGCIA